jgi:hypothetical protein
MSADVAADPIRWKAHARIDKWSDQSVAHAQRITGQDFVTGDDMTSIGLAPDDVVDIPDNLLTTAGLQRITNLIIGAGGQALTQTATRLGVGNSSTAATVLQADLQAAAGAGNRLFKALDTAPTAVNGVMTFKTTFQGGDANFAWNEWALDVGTPTVADGTTVGALMVNRRVPGTSMGTKTSGAWTLTVTITLS